MDELELALARTTLLVRRDIYPGLEHSAIAEVLLGQRVRIRIDAESCESNSGQTSLVASALLVAELGASVAIDVPRVKTLMPRPPLRGEWLDSALVGAVDGLISPAWTGDGSSNVTVLLGAARPDARDRDLVLRITGDGFGAEAQAPRSAAISWREQAPFGGVAAGILAAAEVFRDAMVKLGRATGQGPADHAVQGFRPATFRLPRLHGTLPEFGDIDVISAGAITNNCLFTLFQIPRARRRLRILDNDIVDRTNLNRCPLFRSTDVGDKKVEALRGWETDRLGIVASSDRLDRDWLAEHDRLADTVLVGVDHIPTRWLVQRHASAAVFVGATSHFLALSSAHLPGGPCSGCLHSRDDEIGGDIPTVSFVSAAAGLLQAYQLVAQVGSAPGRAAGWQMYPFSLAEPRGLQPLPLAANPSCPVGCEAARAIAA